MSYLYLAMWIVYVVTVGASIGHLFSVLAKRRG